MTHYSYLKEPVLERSGYTIGYKTGSLSYLENGKINFSDEIIYYDGQRDADHDEIGDDLNTTVEHNQYVYFDGEKGISEFYAKGFYPNNRAISAWKKIRYDDLSYNFSRSTGKVGKMYLGGYSWVRGSGLSESGDRVNGSYNLYKDGKSYYSNRIVVTANVTMGPVEDADGEYDFNYVADVTNGVVEIKDATGWTNETRARRIDWERDALMLGDVNVTNRLRSRGLFFPAAGDEVDWLPCCFSGTIPPIQNEDRSKVLKPNKILPENKTCTSKRLQECYDKCGNNLVNGSSAYDECLKECNSTCTNFTCIEGSCPGFECIYTYDEGEGDGAGVVGAGAKPLVQEFRVQVIHTIRSVSDFGANQDDLEDLLKRSRNNLTNGDVVTYRIDVTYGDANNALKNVTITDTLPDGLNYVRGSSELWFEAKSPDAILSEDEKEHKNIEPLGNNTVLTWEVPEIKPGRWLFIGMETTVTAPSPPDCLVFENAAKVEGHVETETERVERKTDDVKAVIIVAGETYDCQGQI